MANTHVFKVVALHPEDGFLTVEWDGIEGRRITCPIPLDENGVPLAGATFASAILAACKDRLLLWDRLVGADLTVAERLVGQAFDVTDEFILGSV
jgi:hypothetical protein